MQWQILHMNARVKYDNFYRCYFEFLPCFCRHSHDAILLYTAEFKIARRLDAKNLLKDGPVGQGMKYLSIQAEKIFEG